MPAGSPPLRSAMWLFTNSSAVCGPPVKLDLSGHAVFVGVSESSYRLPYASRRRIADRTELTPVGFGPEALERGPIFDKWSRVLALFGPNFRLLLASGLGHFAAFHMLALNRGHALRATSGESLETPSQCELELPSNDPTCSSRKRRGRSESGRRERDYILVQASRGNNGRLRLVLGAETWLRTLRLASDAGRISSDHPES